MKRNCQLTGSLCFHVFVYPCTPRELGRNQKLKLVFIDLINTTTTVAGTKIYQKEKLTFFRKKNDNIFFR